MPNVGLFKMGPKSAVPTSQRQAAWWTFSGATRHKPAAGTRRPNQKQQQQQIKSIIVIYSTLVIVFGVSWLAPLRIGAISSNELIQQQQQQPRDKPAGVNNTTPREPKQLVLDQLAKDQNGFQLHDLYSMNLYQQQQDQRNLATALSNQAAPARSDSPQASLGELPISTNETTTSSNTNITWDSSSGSSNRSATGGAPLECPNGLLTFELSTGFIYKPTTTDDTLSMMPSTLQLTDCLDYCLHNSSCLAINFEMGLCVLLATSAKHNPQNLHSSQFPVFTIYAEKKCLLTEPSQARHRRRCQRAWTFERVAGYEMKIKPRRRLKLASKELCMDACLVEREFACRSANWYRQTGECTLSDQDRHSVSQSEAGDQQIKASLSNFYGPQNMTTANGLQQQARPSLSSGPHQYHHHLSSFQRHYSGAGQQHPLAAGSSIADRTRLNGQLDPTARLTATVTGASLSSDATNYNERRLAPFKQLFHRTQSAATINGNNNNRRSGRQNSQGATMGAGGSSPSGNQDQPMMERQADWPTDSSNSLPNQEQQQHYVDLPVLVSTGVDYLENNCIYEPNKLCEFRKIQNRVLKTVDSIYQEVATLDECRQKCLNAPYRCYSFDYGDTSERVCRTSHLDQASLLSVNEPYLEVVGAITYELAACFNVSIQCRAKGMVALVTASKSFNGKIYAKSRPTSCVNDVTNSLQFELSMKYHDEQCDVRASSNQQQGVFSNDIVIQHHDRIVTTQDVGLSVYCQYDLGNRSVTNNVDLAIERLPDGPMESKQQAGMVGGQQATQNNGPLTITGLATTVVRSPNVTMRITNMNGQPVTSATVGDRLALLFEIKEKTSPFGILVREIVAMDGRQLAAGQNNLNSSWTTSAGGLHQNSSSQQLAQIDNHHQYASDDLLAGNSSSSFIEAANSIQFLDHDGCPTDANLMGPLVRMDPQGHRLLAPFDAFKFPASDMVFFRAVVSSCVAECKPVVCGGSNGGSGNGGSSLSSSSSSGGQGHELAASAYGDLFSPTPPDDMVTTTRNMPIIATTAQRQQPAASTSFTGATESPGLAGASLASSTTMLPPSSPTTSSTTTSTTTIATTMMTSTATPSQSLQQQQQQPARSSSTLAPYEPSRTTKLHNHKEQPPMEAWPNLGADLLTTVPGFNIHQQQQQLNQQQRNQQQPEAGQGAYGDSSNSISSSGSVSTMATTINLPDATQSYTTPNPTTNGAADAVAATYPQQVVSDSLGQSPGPNSLMNEPNSLMSGADNSHHLTINMTNNHNLGRPSPRPMTTSTTAKAGAESEQFENDLHARDQQQQQQQLSTSGQPDRRPLPLPPPAKLDPLTAQERQAILDLLSGHEKSSLLSGQLHQSASSSSLVDEQIITSGLMKLYPILESFRHGNSRSRELSTRPAGNQTTSGVLQEIKALISDQFQRGLDQPGAESGPKSSNEDSYNNNSGHARATAPAMSAGSAASQQNKMKRSSAEFISIPAPSQEFVELINRTLIDYIIAEELKSTLLTQMLIDEARATTVHDYNRPESGDDHLLAGHSRPGANRKEGRNLANELDNLSPELQSSEFPADLLEKFFTKLNWRPLERFGGGNNNKETRTGTGLSYEQVGRLVKARFDQELAGKIQRILKLLDESKSLVKTQQQQQRFKRDTAAADDQLMRSSSYVYMSQPQFSSLRSSNGPRFTKGHVELYHTNQLYRIKRQAPSFEEFEAHPQSASHQKSASAQPEYEIEEMIVQSIKIVDRLQFEDELQKNKEEQQHANNGAAARDNDTPSPALRRRLMAKHARRDFDMTPQANRQLVEDDSMSDGSIERQLDDQLPIMKSRLTAINILLVALCFIFIQISMVLLCLINWNNQRPRQPRRSLFADLTPFKTVDRSTISSSSSTTYSDCSNYR